MSKVVSFPPLLTWIVRKGKVLLQDYDAIGGGSGKTQTFVVVAIDVGNGG